MSHDLRRTVERAIEALHAIANDLEHSPVLSERVVPYEQRVADRLRGIAEALELAAHQEESGPGDGPPATPLLVPQETPDEQQMHPNLPSLPTVWRAPGVLRASAEDPDEDPHEDPHDGEEEP
jgi:hypothetical protein